MLTLYLIIFGATLGLFYYFFNSKNPIPKEEIKDATVSPVKEEKRDVGNIVENSGIW